MRKFLWIIIAFALVIALVLASWRLLKPGEKPAPGAAPISQATEYRCSEGKSIKTTFTENGIRVSLSDGRAFSLSHIPAASGAKYADAAGTIVFWSKKYSAFLEESGETTYRRCVVHPLPFSNTGG